MLVRDAVHGDIWVRNEFRPLLDCREFQRLREIRQLGTAHLVYPTALHTRFDHSLGTYHVCRVLLDILEKKGTRFEARHRILAEAYALLHDITHVPFGHTLEDECRIFDRHDRFERYQPYLEASAIGEALDGLGIKKDFVGILEHHPTLPPFISELVSGTIGADILDYLKRDAYFCGLESRYDARILQAFEIDERGAVFINLEKRGCLRQDLLSELINLLRIRYYLSERVYYHHTKIVAGAMLARAVEAVGISQASLSAMTEADLFRVLSDRGETSGVATLVAGVLDRRLFKRCFMVSPRSESAGLRKQDFVDRFHGEAARGAEKVIAGRLGIDPVTVLVYCPPGGMFMKEATVPIRAGDSSLKILSEIKNLEIEAILENYARLWRFFVFVDPGVPLEKALASCEDFFGMASEYRPPGCPRVSTGRPAAPDRGDKE